MRVGDRVDKVHAEGASDPDDDTAAAELTIVLGSLGRVVEEGHGLEEGLRHAGHGRYLGSRTVVAT
jgi:hypothetical protein